MEPIGPLDDDARDLLAAYRSVRPGATSRARNWSAVCERVEPPAPHRAAQRTWWIGAAVFAVAAAILVLARSLLGAWQAGIDARALPPAAGDVLAAPTADAEVVRRLPEPAVVPAGPPVQSPARTDDVPLQRPRVHGTSPADPTPTPGLDGAREEVELVAAARRSLGERDWPRALALLDAHARRFPDGVLAEERAALRAIALCRSHADGADAAVRAFESSHPGSHHHRSITQACRVADNPASP
jgi:hypothetical protein